MARTGRPREFDEEQVVDAARDLFWRRGYANTSVGDLEDGLGVLRGSLYGAFGDKHGLFLRALRRYADEGRTESAALAGEGPILPRLGDVLRGALDAATDRPGWGCLFGNTAAELLPGDGQAAEVVERGLRNLERAIAAALARGQETGEVRAAVDPGPSARMLVALLQGLHVVARVEEDPRRLADAVDAALATLAA